MLCKCRLHPAQPVSAAPTRRFQTKSPKRRQHQSIINMQIREWGEPGMQSNQVLQIELLFCQYLPRHGNTLVPADQSLLVSTLLCAVSAPLPSARPHLK